MNKNKVRIQYNLVDVSVKDYELINPIKDTKDLNECMFYFKNNTHYTWLQIAQVCQQSLKKLHAAWSRFKYKNSAVVASIPKYRFPGFKEEDLNKLKIEFQLQDSWPDRMKIILVFKEKGYADYQIAEILNITYANINQQISSFYKNPVKYNSKRNISLTECKEGKNYKHLSKEEIFNFKRFRKKKSQSKAEGVEFSLDFEDIQFEEFCPILGIKLNYFVKNNGPCDDSPSFDRIDPNKGYIKGNVVLISQKANRIKNNGTSEELRKIADYLDNLQKLIPTS